MLFDSEWMRRWSIFCMYIEVVRMRFHFRLYVCLFCRQDNFRLIQAGQSINQSKSREVGVRWRDSVWFESWEVSECENTYFTTTKRKQRPSKRREDRRTKERITVLENKRLSSWKLQAHKKSFSKRRTIRPRTLLKLNEFKSEVNVKNIKKFVSVFCIVTERVVV